MQIITNHDIVSNVESHKCFIQISGMTCASCVAAIEKHTLKMNGKQMKFCIAIYQLNILFNNFCSGVTKVLIALMAGKAEVYYDKTLVSPQAICDWITTLGFPSVLQSESCSTTKNGAIQENGKAEIELRIGGMTCSSCVYNIESHVAKMDGVFKARVALSTQKGAFTYDPDRTGPRQIIDQITVLLLKYIFRNRVRKRFFFLLLESRI